MMSNTNSNKRLTKMSSMMSIGSHNYKENNKCIRSIRDDAIETMVVGVNWDDQQELDKDDKDDNDKDDNDHNQPEDTTSSSTATIHTSSRLDPVYITSSPTELVVDPDLEQAAAATVATLVRASQRRRSSTTTNTNTTTTTISHSHSLRSPTPTLLTRDEPLPRASKSTPCKSWRLVVMNVLGVGLIVGGIVWATLQYLAAPRYVSVDTGRPVAAVVCSSGDHNTTSLLSTVQQEQVEDVCRSVEPWQQPCTFAIFYTFSVQEENEDDGLLVASSSSLNSTNTNSSNINININNNQTTTSTVSYHLYAGVDTWQFDDPSDHHCHTHLAERHAAYMAQPNFTVHYQTGRPAETNTYEAPTLQPHTMAAIIAAIACGLGLLFLCSSLLECVC